MIGATAKVVSSSKPGNGIQYSVRVEGELWQADSVDSLKTGELVTITGIDGLRLRVQRLSSSQAESSSSS